MFIPRQSSWNVPLIEALNRKVMERANGVEAPQNSPHVRERLVSYWRACSSTVRAGDS